MKIKEVLNALEHFAPLPLQASYDNAGLQVGLTAAEVSGVLLCLDVTESIVEEAISLGCNLIVSHHPLIFGKLTQISDNSYVQRTIIKAIKNDITIAAMHTNLDAVEGGVNYKIAKYIGLLNLQFLGTEQQVGTVKGSDGIIGELSKSIAADDLLLLLKDRFNVECVQANKLLQRPIKRIALCGGAGSFLLCDAIKAGADAFITGEMHYHDYFGHEQEIQICTIGHYQSEQFTIELLQEIIEDKCTGVKCFKTSINTNPILYI